MNLSQITMGLQAETAGLMNDLFALRNNLEIMSRNLTKETTSALAAAASANSDSTFKGVKKQSDQMQTEGWGEVSSGIAQGGGVAAGEYFGGQAESKVTEAQNEARGIKTQIENAKTELQAGVGHQPANAALGAVRDPATINAEIDRLHKEHDQALQKMDRAQQEVQSIKQKYQNIGQSAAGGIKGSAQITASNAISDKAKFDAANVIYQFAQQVLSKIVDMLSQMAQSQEAARRDLGQTLSALTAANSYHA